MTPWIEIRVSPELLACSPHLTIEQAIEFTECQETQELMSMLRGTSYERID